jgi:hypothetical protein
MDLEAEFTSTKAARDQLAVCSIYDLWLRDLAAFEACYLGDYAKECEDLVPCGTSSCVHQEDCAAAAAAATAAAAAAAAAAATATAGAAMPRKRAKVTHV